MNNCLNITISGNGVNTAAVIKKPTAVPVLTLSQTLAPTGNVKQNSTASFNITITNTGTEFYSNLGIYLYSPTDTSAHQFVNYGVACIPSGETKNFTLSGNIACAPGNYYAVAVYDSTNYYSKTDYKSMYPAGYNSVPITVLPGITTIYPRKISENDQMNCCIYPNPVQDILYINGTQVIGNVKITDLSGRFISENKNIRKIFVGHLKAGIYLIRIETENCIKTERFIKK